MKTLFENENIKVEEIHDCNIVVTYKGEEISIVCSKGTDKRYENSIMIPNSFSAIWQDKDKSLLNRTTEIRHHQVIELENIKSKFNTIVDAMSILKGEL